MTNPALNSRINIMLTNRRAKEVVSVRPSSEYSEALEQI